MFLNDSITCSYIVFLLQSDVIEKWKTEDKMQFSLMHVNYLQQSKWTVINCCSWCYGRPLGGPAGQGAGRVWPGGERIATSGLRVQHPVRLVRLAGDDGATRPDGPVAPRPSQARAQLEHRAAGGGAVLYRGRRHHRRRSHARQSRGKSIWSQWALLLTYHARGKWEWRLMCSRDSVCTQKRAWNFPTQLWPRVGKFWQGDERNCIDLKHCFANSNVFAVMCQVPAIYCFGQLSFGLIKTTWSMWLSYLLDAWSTICMEIWLFWNGKGNHYNSKLTSSSSSWIKFKIAE